MSNTNHTELAKQKIEQHERHRAGKTDRFASSVWFVLLNLLFCQLCVVRVAHSLVLPALCGSCCSIFSFASSVWFLLLNL
jgi:hypothetical protein